MILLTNRSVIKVTGDDRAEFLQGLITNDINKLSEQIALYAAILTAQGKYLFDFFLYKQNDAIYLDVATIRAADLIKKLSIYKLRSKVEIALAPEFKIYSDPHKGLVDPRRAELGHRFLTTENLKQNGDMDEYERLRITLGVPDSADLIPDKSFIMQNNFEELNGVDFNKGCYVGQEVVARTKYKGNVSKKLYRASGEHALESFGTPIIVNGKTIGEMRSSIGNAGLAQCDIEAVEAGGEFICGQNKIQLTEILK